MEMNSGGEDSRKNHEIAVSGVVLLDNKALLVRSMLEENEGEWAMPGGYVKSKETIDDAIKREILEEIGIQPALEGLIAVRNKVSETEEENEVCFIFLLRAADDKAFPDGKEVDAAQYVSLAELDAVRNLNTLSKKVITSTLKRETQVLRLHQHPDNPPSEYIIYM
jgi:ADP-ribose pyrophosphatase YjhB (NUDIX family)